MRHQSAGRLNIYFVYYLSSGLDTCNLTVLQLGNSKEVGMTSEHFGSILEKSPCLTSKHGWLSEICSCYVIA